MALESIVAGLSGLKTAADLAKYLRDGLKAGSVKPDEIEGRIGEIYGYIIDSRAALLQADEENFRLRKIIARYDDLKTLESDLKFQNDGGFYVRASEAIGNVLIPYCPVCWGTKKQLVVLSRGAMEGIYSCAIDHSSYQTEAYKNFISDLLKS